MLELVFCLFTLSTPTHFMPQRGHSEVVRALCFSPDGRLLASAGNDKEVYLWELESGKLVQTLPIGDRGITRLQFHPAGDRLYGTSMNGTFRMWHLETGEWEDLFKVSDVLSDATEPRALDFDLSANQAVIYANHPAKLVMTVPEDVTENGWYYEPSLFKQVYQRGEEIKPYLLDLTNHRFEPLRFSRVPTGRLRFGPDGKHMISSAKDHPVVLWDMATKKAVWKLKHWGGRLLEASFSPNGNLVACSLSFTNHINKHPNLAGTQFQEHVFKTIVLDVKTGEPVSDLAGYNQAVLAFKWLDENQIYTGSYGDRAMDFSGFLVSKTPKAAQNISLWNLQTGMRDIVLEDTSFSQVAFHPERSWLAYPHNYGRPKHDYGIKIFHFTDRVHIRAFQPLVKSVKKIALSPDGKRFATIHQNDNQIYLWDPQGVSKLRLLDGHTGPVNTIAFHPSGLLASGGDDFSVLLWNTQNSKVVRTLRGHNHPVKDLAFVPGTSELISTASNPLEEKGGSIIKWDVESGRRLPAFLDKDRPRKFPKIRDLLYPGSNQLILRFVPDDFLGIGYDRVRSWDMAKNKWGPLKTSWGVSQDVMALSQDGRSFFSASNKKLFFQDVTTGSTTAEIEFNSINLRAACFLGDGTLLTGDRSSILRWDPNKMAPINVYSKHHDRVTTLVPVPNSSKILSAEQGGLLKLWDLKDDSEMLTMAVIAGSSDYLMYTSSGLYMGTPGGRRAVTAVFEGFETGSLHQVRHNNRPDLILEHFPHMPAKVLRSHRELVEEKGLAKPTGAVLLPTLKLTNRDAIPYFTREEAITLGYRARPGDAALATVRVWADGVPQRAPKNFEGEVQVLLAKGPNLIEIAVTDTLGNSSKRHQVVVERSADRLAPDLYLLTLGVSDYPGTSKDLAYAAKDARDLVTYFNENHHGFNKVHTSSLYDREVTLDRFEDMRRFLEQGKVDDQVLVFLSGHGKLEDQHFYFAAGDMDFANPTRRAIPFEHLDQLLGGLPQRRKLMIIDACNSGRFDPDAKVEEDASGAEGAKGSLLLENALETSSFRLEDSLFSDLAVNSGTTVLAASQGFQEAQERTSLSNGVFTYNLLRGLRMGSADLDRDGWFRLSEVMRYTTGKVIEATAGNQVPEFRHANVLLDFPLFPSPRRTFDPIPKRAQSQSTSPIHSYKDQPKPGPIPLDALKLGGKFTKHLKPLFPTREPDIYWYPQLENFKAEKRISRAEGQFEVTSPKTISYFRPNSIFKPFKRMPQLNSAFPIRNSVKGTFGTMLVSVPYTHFTIDEIKEQICTHDYRKSLEFIAKAHRRFRTSNIYTMVREKWVDKRATILREEPCQIKGRDWLLVVTRNTYELSKNTTQAIFYHYIYKDPSLTIVVSFNSGLPFYEPVAELYSTEFEEELGPMMERITIK